MWCKQEVSLHKYCVCGCLCVFANNAQQCTYKHTLTPLCAIITSIWTYQHLCGDVILIQIHPNCSKHNHDELALIRKQSVKRKFCWALCNTSVTQGTCLYNGTFPTHPVLLRYLHPKPCHPLRWLMLCGPNHHPYGRGGTSFLSQLQCHSGVFLHTHNMPALKHTHRNCGWCSNLASWSHLLASCATLSIAWNRSHSRAGSSALKRCKGRGHCFFSKFR